MKLIPGIDYIGITTPFYCNDGKGLFVMHKRSKNCRDEVGTWDFGGGKLEFGQQLEDNVLREVKEEYGVLGTLQEQLPPYEIFRELNGEKTHWLAIPFFVKVDIQQVTNNEPDKLEEIGFFRLNSLPSPLHSGIKKALTIYPEYFEKYRNSPSDIINS